LHPLRRQPRGYVLIVALGLLVLAATLLVGIARSSMAHALLARTEQAELQRRWGAVSCRNAVLPNANDILTIQERLRNRPIPVLRETLVLGDERFTLIVSDEQAKANVNSLLERSDKAGAEGRVRDAVAGSGLGNLILLRPEPLPLREGQPTSRPSEYAGPPPWVTSFGQVFNNVLPERLIAGSGARPAEQLTCWGNGAINVMRVSETALKLAATPAMTNVEAGRLIDARNAAFASRTRPKLMSSANAPAPGLDAASALLSQAEVDPKVRRTVGFTAKSTCFSLWVVTQDPRRTWYRLYVIDDYDTKQARVESFAW
jgi:hypothetical protein